ncbi:hypothetical protein Tco_0199530 [Tanacetum coccineum]
MITNWPTSLPKPFRWIVKVRNFVRPVDSFLLVIYLKEMLPRDTPLDRVEVLSSAVGDLRDVPVMRTSKYDESNAIALEDLTLQARNPVKEALLN